MPLPVRVTNTPAKPLAGESFGSLKPKFAGVNVSVGVNGGEHSADDVKCAAEIWAGVDYIEPDALPNFGRKRMMVVLKGDEGEVNLGVLPIEVAVYRQGDTPMRRASDRRRVRTRTRKAVGE